MARKGALHRTLKNKRASGDNSSFQEITIGEVVDTNDPQQMGRIRVKCPYFGDLENDPISKMPWATYVSPLAGTTFSPARGRGEEQTPGQVAYGMFNIPKVGSSVLIACIEADPRFRIWFGCVHDQYFPHTLPHGRYSYKTTNKPDGPFSSSEDKIQPLYDSQTAAFTNPAAGVEPRKSFEFRTRAADTSVAGLGPDYVNTEESAVSKLADDNDVEYGDNPSGGKYTNTQGYHKSRIEPGIEDVNSNETTYDPQTYSWTTPGFHSISMQDNAENCRIRIRTTHGHQIIMDDTNERIYISTGGGKTWIEMDEVGNIDIYGERNISVHAGKDINYTADEAFRVNAKNIHFSAEEDIKLHSKGGGISVIATEDVFISGTELNLTSDIDILLTAGDALNLLATGNIVNTAAEIHLNGPPAASAAVGSTASTASRIPQHEPWARTMILDDGTPEFAYDSDDVGRKENGEELGRNPKWHR